MNLTPWRNKNTQGNIEHHDHPMARFRNEMESVVERFFREPWGGRLGDMTRSALAWDPRLDVADSEDDVVVNVELPGVDPKDVDVSVTGNVLTVRGRKQREKEEKRRGYCYVERDYGAFARSVQLPASVNPDKVDATFKDGVLTVKLDKRQDAKPKRISVRNA